jgi:hypothetical protein
MFGGVVYTLYIAVIKESNMVTINETSYEIKGKICSKGTWEKVEIVRASTYDNGTKEDVVIISFGDYFNDEASANKFMQGRFFKSCLAAAIKNIK